MCGIASKSVLRSCWAVFLLTIMCLLSGKVVAAPAAEVAALIAQAGNTEDESERLAALKRLAESPAADEALRNDARHLAEFVQRWQGSSLKFYLGQIKGKRPQVLAEYDFQIRSDSPLAPLAALYRGRMLAWTLIENSTVRTDPKWAPWFHDESVRAFREAEAAFPRNRIPGMYQGRAIPNPKSYAPVPGAPRWAQLQREHLDRFREIICWWIEHRQRSNGEFGGGWGDDCEMWRWWAPVLLGFEDPEVLVGQLKFSRTAMDRPHLKGGFNTVVTDVEHAAEDTTDNLVPLLLLDASNPRWTEWSASLAGLLDRVWTGTNQRNQRQFKSFYFSGTETSPNPGRALDVIANVAAVNPALLVWLQTRDPALTRPLGEWLMTWVDATTRAENGKPAGILPASIRWPDGAVAGSRSLSQNSRGQVGRPSGTDQPTGSGAGPEDHWWEPVAPGGFMHSYYIWPSVITEMTDALLVARLVTGEERFLQPIRSMAAIRLGYLKNPPREEPQPGTLAWCAQRLAPPANANSNIGALVKTLAKCRALLGTSEFDELIRLDAGDAVILPDAPGRQRLEQALEESLATLRVNFPGFTSEVRSTDRCMRFVQFLARDAKFDEYLGVTLPKHELVYRMATGDANAPRFPMPAVRWRTPSRDIAVLVTEAGTDRFQAELFHFGADPRALVAELRLLKPGRYRVEVTAAGRPIDTPPPAELAVSGPVTPLALQLPPQQLCVLTLAPLDNR